MKYIKFFSELNQHDILLAGGKGASLGEMTQIGLPVPAGFCLTTTAYTAFVAANGLQEQIINHARQDGQGEQSIRELFTHAVMPKPILDELTTAYGQLEKTAVAVRSSATAEDLPEASFAGQQDTYLNIQGIDAVKTAVQNCWASLWTDRAVTYRERENIPLDEVSMAVVVQELIAADSAGVLFTANPVNGARDEIVINAAWGLGEAVVSGLVTPDTITVDKTDGQTKNEQIADKKVMTVRTAAGSAEQAVPEEKRRVPVLNSEQISQLAALARAVENHAKRPMDLEWSFADGRLHLLQARPITALPEQMETLDLMGAEWSRLMLIERYPEPITPFTWSVTADMLFSSLEMSMSVMGGSFPEDSPPLINQLYGIPYINITLLEQGFASSPARPPVEVESDEPKEDSPRPSLKDLPSLLATFARLGKLIRNTHRQWDNLLEAYVTAVRQDADREWESFSTADLLPLFIGQYTRVAPLLENHAYSIVAAEISLQLLQAITRAWLDDEDGHLATTMLSGLTGNMTMETNRALWRLAVQARPHKQLRHLLSAPLADDWRKQIAVLPGGSSFLTELDSFLRLYGHRAPRYEMMHPTWVEQPQQILEMIRAYLDEAVIDPGEGEIRQAAARETAVRQARERLPLPKRLIFDRALPLAQTYFRLRENQQFYLVMTLPTLRRILAIFEDRLREAGILQEKDDIFFLENAEIQTLIAQFAGSQDDDTLLTTATQLVTERRAALKRYHKMRPPMTLGGKRKTAVSKTAVSKTAVASASNNSLHGIAASSGTVSGKARIVRGPADFSTLQYGEILITPATTPAWTPLFGIAAGLVTDYGGLLSHSGVVAREYGLPAVLGTDDATKRIKNGDTITIDGDKGIVLL